MRFPKFNRVLRCQEESGNVTNVGGPTDISTDITYLELHREHSSGPDEVRLRKDDDVLVTWQTHLDVLS